MEETLQEVKRTERGWAAHFAGASKCNFRRNTLLECGNIHLVVSTIGDYRPKDDGKLALVNAYGFYETLVFKAVKPPFWDADPHTIIHRIRGTDGKWCIDKISHTVDLEANDMHEAIVYRLSEQLRAGGKLEG